MLSFSDNTLLSLDLVSSKLTLLETLDKTNFNLSGSECCVDFLYKKMFDKDPHEMTEVFSIFLNFENIEN